MQREEMQSERKHGEKVVEELKGKEDQEEVRAEKGKEEGHPDQGRGEKKMGGEVGHGESVVLLSAKGRNSGLRAV